MNPTPAVRPAHGLLAALALTFTLALCSAGPVEAVEAPAESSLVVAKKAQPKKNTKGKKAKKSTAGKSVQKNKSAKKGGSGGGGGGLITQIRRDEARLLSDLNRLKRILK